MSASALLRASCAALAVAISLAATCYEISTGVCYPVLQFGTCTDGKDPITPCSGTNLTATLGPWLQAQLAAEGMAALDTQLRYNWTRVVGRELKRIQIPRTQLWITSKIDPKAYCHATNVKAAASAMIRESLSQLGVTYVDLMLLHEPCESTGAPAEGDMQAWMALNEAMGLGLTRAVGLDKFSVQQMEALSSKPAVLMQELSMTRHANATVAYCHSHGIHINAFGVIHGCPFTDPLVLALAHKYDATPAQICQTWTRQQGHSMAIGVGLDPVKAAAYTREDLGIFRFNLTLAEMNELSLLAHAG